MSKTVFFGPFIGEFGWEILWWQGWVRKVCLGEYKDYRKIAASSPGRDILYPYVDEFWPHPPELANLKISSRNYITDYWRDGLPYSPDGEPTDDVELVVNAVLDEYKSRLPEDTIYYIPFRNNFYEPDNLKFGVYDYRTAAVNKITFDYQKIEKLEPTEAANNAFRRIYDGSQQLIALFPRFRDIRRPDKNWPKKKYDGLIDKLQQRYPEYQLAIFGSPSGAYYADGVPSGTLDLINVPSSERLGIQVAALANTQLALGGMSGAILFSLMCGCPTIAWGLKSQEAYYHEENALKTKFIYHPKMKCSVHKVLKLIRNFDVL